MSPFRDAIRIAIFERLQNDSVNLTKTREEVNHIIEEYAKSYSNFDEKEKLNLELTIPIQLPPNCQTGHCKAVVDEVKKAFNQLGGGSRIFKAEGSWLDEEENVVVDKCVIVFSAIPIKKWFDSIPVLQQLIKEIQTKLFQECVFLRIDGQTYGPPINLLNKSVTEDFPNIAQFGEIDPSCEPMQDPYESPSHKASTTQISNSHNNIQISAGGNAHIALGDGANVIGSVTNVYNQGVPTEMHAEILAEIMDLKNKLSELLHNFEHAKTFSQQKMFAEQSSDLGQELINRTDAGISPDSILHVGRASLAVAKLERAKEQFILARHEYQRNGNKSGEALAVFHLGIIAEVDGSMNIAEENYAESIKLNGGNVTWDGLDAFGGLGDIARIRGDFKSAQHYYEESLKSYYQSPNEKGKSRALGDLGNIARITGDLFLADQLLNQSLEIKIRVGHLAGESHIYNSLGALAELNHDFHEAERLHKLSLDINKKIEDKHGESATLNSLAKLQINIGAYDNAEELLNQSIELSKNIPYPHGESISFDLLAKISEIRGQFDLAISYLEKSREIKKKIGAKVGEASILNNLGILAETKGEQEQARQLFRESADLFNNLGATWTEVIVLQNLFRNERNLEHSNLTSIAEAESFDGHESKAILEEINSKIGSFETQPWAAAMRHPMFEENKISSYSVSRHESYDREQFFIEDAEDDESRGTMPRETSLKLLAESCQSRGNFENALFYFDQARELAKNIIENLGPEPGRDDSIDPNFLRRDTMIRCDLKMADLLTIQQKYEQAKTILEGIPKINSELEDPEDSKYHDAAVFYQLGAIAYLTNDYETAKEQFTKSKAMYDSINDYDSTPSSCMLAILYLRDNQSDVAEDVLPKLDDYYLGSVNDTKLQAVLGYIAEQKGDQQKAKLYYNKAFLLNADNCMEHKTIWIHDDQF